MRAARPTSAACVPEGLTDNQSAPVEVMEGEEDLSDEGRDDDTVEVETEDGEE